MDAHEQEPNAQQHIPVLLEQVVAALAPADGEVFIDGTFGAGGYARALLDAAACQVIGIDRDPDVVGASRALQDAYGGRLAVVQGRFSDMAAIATARGHPLVDGVVLDIGVSSMQLDRPERGFSFRSDGPLDMRMEQSGPSAADLVNTLEEGELADLIYRYGEERASRRIARAIVRQREHAPYSRTLELADTVSACLPPRRYGEKHPATRTFQALRIAVNDELGEIARALEAGEKILKPGGRLVIVTFHSLEDRIVKRFLAERSGRAGSVSRHLPQGAGPEPTFRLGKLNNSAAGEDERERNPRARSARMRVGIRTQAPVPERTHDEGPRRKRGRGR